jgi:hypothetical protein
MAWKSNGTFGCQKILPSRFYACIGQGVNRKAGRRASEVEMSLAFR